MILLQNHVFNKQCFWFSINCCRFLYPIYPLICVSASAVIENIPELFREKYSSRESLLVTVSSNIQYLCLWFIPFYKLKRIKLYNTLILFNMQITKYLRPVILGFILCASHSRTFSLINGYSAPLEVYKLLEHHDDAGLGMSISNRTLFDHYNANTSEYHILLLLQDSNLPLDKEQSPFVKKFSNHWWVLGCLVCQVLFYVWEVNGIDTHHRFLCLTTLAKYGGSMMDSVVFFHSHLTVRLEALQHHLHTSTTRTKRLKNNM